MSQALGASRLSATAAAINVAPMMPIIAQNSVVSGAHFVSSRRPVSRTPARSARWPTVPSVASRLATHDPFPRLAEGSTLAAGAATQTFATEVFAQVLGRRSAATSRLTISHAGVWTGIAASSSQARFYACLAHGTGV